MSNVLLDNPVLASLYYSQDELGRCSEQAAVYHPDISPLAGLTGPLSPALRELAALVPKGSGVGVVTVEEALPERPEWRALGVIRLHQMVCEAPSPSPKAEAEAEAEEFDDLTTTDVPDMLELAQLTDPGPFLARTIEMGRYIGVRKGARKGVQDGARTEGRLVAMAGERMRLPDWVEISAVCTHPDGRGHGYASRLVASLLKDCFANQQCAFLHVRDGSLSEASATAIYERLGFRHRRDLFGHFMQRTEADS
jgi:predicted GNAT family acetyltransferase